jgi:HK97 gp10 family phage protein
MREFSLTGFVAFLGGMAVEVERSKHEALEKAAVIVETEAKRVIGTYDYGWPPLAPSTIEKKAADTPLLETGAMRDSITHSVDGDEARVGSNEDTALWQELGTSKIPPRPFLQGAVQHKLPEVMQEIGQVAVKVLTNK